MIGIFFGRHSFHEATVYSKLFSFLKQKQDQKEKDIGAQEAWNQDRTKNNVKSIDCMKLNHQYGCFKEDDPWTNKKIQIQCGMVGYHLND